jgi:hypothetical protein
MTEDPDRIRKLRDDFNQECLFIPSFFPFNAADLEALVFGRHNEEQPNIGTKSYRVKNSTRDFTHYLRRECDLVTVTVYATKGATPSCRITLTRNANDGLFLSQGTHDMLGKGGSLRSFFASFSFRLEAFSKYPTLLADRPATLELWSRVFQRLGVDSDGLSRENLIDRFARVHLAFRGLTDHLNKHWDESENRWEFLKTLDRFRLKDPVLGVLVPLLPYLDPADQTDLENVIYLRGENPSQNDLAHAAEDLGISGASTLRYLLAQPPLSMAFWFFAMAAQESALQDRLGTAMLLKEAHSMGGFYSRRGKEVEQLLRDLSLVDFRDRPVSFCNAIAVLNQLFREDYWRIRTVPLLEERCSKYPMDDMLKLSADARMASVATNERFENTGALTLENWIPLLGKEFLTSRAPVVVWEESSESELLGEIVPENKDPSRVGVSFETGAPTVRLPGSIGSGSASSPGSRPSRDTSPKRRGRPSKMPKKYL